MLLEKYQSILPNQRKNYIKTLDNIKRKPPKNLDVIVQHAHEETFRNIDCLQCANCCKTTGPLFTPRDILRISHFFKMKPAAFENKFLRKDEDGDLVLQSLPCNFLDQDNNCSIYEIRPKACQEFPHTDRKKLFQINHLTKKNIEICPAVGEFLYVLDKKLYSK